MHMYKYVEYRLDIPTHSFIFCVDGKTVSVSKQLFDLTDVTVRDALRDEGIDLPGSNPEDYELKVSWSHIYHEYDVHGNSMVSWDLTHRK